MVESTVKVPLPEMGESVTEGSIVEWRKRPGEWIEAGDTLVEVTTDKVDVEVPAPASGVLVAVHAPDGETVSVGTVIAEIDTAAAKPEGGAAPAPAAASANGNGSASNGAKPEAPEVTPASYGARGSAAPPAETHRNGITGSGLATAQARRVARTHNIDLASVAGTGPDGLVLRSDVDDAIAKGTAKPVPGANGASPALPPPPAPPREATLVPLKGPAGALVGYMEQSLTIPTATSFRTIQVGTLDVRRAALNTALKAAGRSEKISFTHLIAWALVQVAREMPFIAYSFARDGKTPQRVQNPINLGLAVDVERKGERFLIVPVLKNAAALDFAGFRAAYEDLVARARDNKLGADDLSGASFTLTNPGGIGTVASIPRLMAGQGAIVAAGAITYPPGFQKAPKATLESLGVEKIMTLTNTYDHRVIQGAQSGEFLRRVDELLGGASNFYEDVAGTFGIGALDGKPATSANAAAPVRSVVEAAASAPVSAAPSEEMLRAVAAGASLVRNYRTHGHLAATLDPLGTEPIGDPSLDPKTYGLTPALQSAVPANVLRVEVPGGTLAEVLPRLRETYSGTIAYEIEHISNTAQRHWLREYIEKGMNRIPLSPERKKQVLGRLTKVEAMERYLRKSFLGQKTFSIEGLDVMVPMLEEIISMLADDGTKSAVLGMAHRGRLSTIAHVVNRPYEELLGEFEMAKVRAEHDEDDDETGDVKYHHGAEGTYVTPAGTEIKVILAHNPSHLEAVDGVVEGLARALQTDHTTNPPTLDFTNAAPILIHGDAAFPGQGVVAEVLNLQSLEGYTTGGTIHIIANNQIGFTTNPEMSRSTRYASDLAKGFDVPIVHVNADDVDACIAAVHLALDYRNKFGRDVIVDLIGYRRFGHNEQDEPAYTQPAMYDRIKNHPTVRELFAANLVAQGLMTNDEVQLLVDAANKRLAEAHAGAKGNAAKLIEHTKSMSYLAEPVRATGVDVQRLTALASELVGVPDGFTLNGKLAKQFERRQQQLLSSGDVDWGLAEALAFATLLDEGRPIRITGQDTERGTFSHRHAVFTDPKSGRQYVPLQHVSGAKASFEIHNSPLSEYACLGFEYGYSSAVPDGLVLWEAQFGDFANNAQVIIDQFIAAGRAKWGQDSRLTLLLPHGYEGQGPEHSSARLERFLQLSAEGNIRVANCSTASQYFHLLRMQALAQNAFPLVVMTPKSLLRLQQSFGTIADLANGAFREAIDDPRYAGGTSRDGVTRVLLCSGKIYHDLIADARYADLKKTAIVRIELLSPFPIEQTLAIIGSYPNVKEVLWVQEEPKNMGARAHARRRLIELMPKGLDIGYVGRPYRASPSEGYPGAHAVEQERIIRAALTE